MWESVYLGTPGLAVKAAVAEDWFRDEVENFRMGFGKGFLGRVHARESLDKALDGGVGIYLKHLPVGLITVEPGPENTKSVKVWMYVKAEVRRTGIGPVALARMMDNLFERYKRVEIDVLLMNKSVVALMKKAGFTQEGTRKHALWVHGHPCSVCPFRMLQTDWKKMKRRKVHYGRNAA